MPLSKTRDLSLIYEGSVKRVFKLQDENDTLWFEFTDDYSVFDWGKMPDQIANKGRALAVIGAHFFEKLSDHQTWRSVPTAPDLTVFRSDWLDRRWEHMVYAHLLSEHGVSSHYQGLVNGLGHPLSFEEAAGSDSIPYLSVLPVEVNHPDPCTLLSQTVFYYPPTKTTAARRLIPLEVVFRFGMPAGSSLKARLETNPDYSRILGLSKKPQEGEWFERPVLEFFTKLEPKDRLLTLQEALVTSGLTPGQFEEMVELSYDLALGLYVLFGQKGIELWDGKFEFAVSREGLMLVDSIGPDELRLLYKGIHLSKEMIRQVYRGSAWEKALKEAQSLASKEGRHDWKDICLSRLKAKPEPLPSAFKAVIDQLYGMLANHLVGRDLFLSHPTLAEFRTAYSKTADGRI